MRNILFVGVCAIIIASCENDTKNPEPIVIASSGDITASIDAFRNLLGSVLNTTTGQTTGRREINWDGVPDIFSSQKIPFNFFNPVAAGSPVALQRGFLYETNVDARVSSSAFADLEPTNGTEFSAFSGSKTFSSVNSNLWNGDFQVAGKAEPAFVHGFGAVFSDVDLAGSTTVEYFSGDHSLGQFKVPVRTTGTHSFLGVYFPHEKVTRIRITQGNSVIAIGDKDISSGGTKDLVIMDDFLYDEPKALQ